LKGNESRSHEQLFYEKSQAKRRKIITRTGGRLNFTPKKCSAVCLGNHFGPGLAAKLLSAVCNLNVQSFTKSGLFEWKRSGFNAHAQKG